MFDKKYNSEESAITTYDYTDLAEGTGKVNYNLCVFEVSGSKTYGLITDNFWSAQVELSGSASYPGDMQKILDVDFDSSSYNKPQILRGTAILNICYALKDLGTEQNTTEGYILARLKKWDGTSETELSSVQSPGINYVTSSGLRVVYSNFLLPMTIANTNFKVGEILRLTIEGWVDPKNTNGVEIYFGADPKDRDGLILSGSKLYTNSSISIPYNLDN